MCILEKLPMPSGMKKEKIMDLLLREEYGYLPEKPSSVSVEVESVDDTFCAGKADLQELKIHCKGSWGDFAFPVHYTYPKEKEEKLPCFIHISFSNSNSDKYQPTEEIIDAGYGIFSFYYEDVTSDNDDFLNGLAGVIYPEGKRTSEQCGKIGLWAWAAMRVLDYAVTLPELDPLRISVVGHSRLGKTALLAGALDERFYCAFSNNSGCSGAAITRNKCGEDIQAIYTTFPHWFCENYKKYMGNEEALPFDQHFLIAANMPHRVYVASAKDDAWADPQNEFLACVAASDYYKENGMRGFLTDKNVPKVGDCFSKGHIGYHLRKGCHYLSREDWILFIEYLQ